MMNLKLLLFIILCPLVALTQKPIINLNEATNEVLSIDALDTNYNDLHFLNESFKNKKIIILGESGHGDGSTFQAKTRIIKYLHEHLGFNTVAFEGGGFFEMYYANLKIDKGAEFKPEFRRSWYHLWSKSEQTKELLNYLEHNQSLKFVGIENQAGNEYWLSFPYILKDLMGKDVYQDIEFTEFKENLISFYNIYFLGNSDYNKDFDLVNLKNELNILYRNSNLINNKHKKHMLHGIRNIQGFIKQLELNYGTYEQQNQSISMRDSLMYENLRFHLNRNPDEKIIIWTANFHAAKNLDQAKYKEGDDFYQTMKTLGHRIYEDYDKELFSLAFISTQGETASIYEAEVDPIVLDDSCWENDLERNLNFDYSFIDFAILKEKYEDNTGFDSCLLGYKSKYGNWLSIFDGVFYIKNMERSILSNDKSK